MNIKIMNLMPWSLIKKEYEGAFLSIDNISDENKLKYLIGFNNEIIKNEIVLKEKIDNKLINKMFY